MQSLRIKRSVKMPSESAVKIFSALGDSTRFKLFNILAREDKICVSEIADQIGISTAGASQQLKVLEGAGMIRRRRMGQKVCYALSDDKQVRKILDAIKE